MIPRDILDRLFEAPVDEFTATRNALVAEAKGANNGSLADEIKAIRKPTVSAWAVNQLARKEKDEVRRLFAIRDDISSAQNASEMRSAAEERKKTIVGLVAKARSILEEAGHPATAQTTERITQTLQAGDSGEERDAIVEGRLSKDLIPSGLGGFGGFEMFSDTDDGDEDDGAAEEEARRRLKALTAEAEEAEAAAEEARAEAERLADEARRAKKAADAAEKKAAKARTAVDEATP